MRPNPKVDSALHVLKGAVQKVLGTWLTTSVFAEGNKGRLTVEYDGKPTQEHMREIEKLANQKIAENVPIEMFEMEREEAEKKFGRIIYDKFPVPSHVKRLTITRIKDWNINCCLGPHVKTTGEIGKIKILKWRARRSRKELEISFEVG
ncbi:alanyl-tRNA editing protein [Archaeoglobales archaeon]|nr:MAG: alanyl-tRNA editing protein [Archaeoglobales archaeon]